MDVLNLNLPPCCHISLPYMTCFNIESNHQRNSNHMLTHIIIIVITALLTSCYSRMSHAKLILYYRSSMLTLQTSVISCALWLPHTRDIGEVRVHQLCDLGKRSLGVIKWGCCDSCPCVACPFTPSFSIY